MIQGNRSALRHTMTLDPTYMATRVDLLMIAFAFITAATYLGINHVF